MSCMMDIHKVTGNLPRPQKGFVLPYRNIRDRIIHYTNNWMKMINRTRTIQRCGRNIYVTRYLLQRQQ